MLVYHRQTRKFMQRVIKPGIKLIDMCETLEETARTLVEANGLKTGRLMWYHTCTSHISQFGLSLSTRAATAINEICMTLCI